PERQDTQLAKAADDFHNAKNADDFKKCLEGKTRAEINEMHRIHQLKYGRSLYADVEAAMPGSHKAGERNSVADALKGTDTVKSLDPRKPIGLQDYDKDELKKLEADDVDVRGLDFRKTTGTKDNGDGTKTTTYKGEIEDSDFWHAKFDTSFTASETRDKDGNVVASKVEYDSPVDQKFLGTNGPVEIKDVKSVETKRDANGNDVTTVNGADGKVYTFVVDPKRNAVVKSPGQ